MHMVQIENVVVGPQNRYPPGGWHSGQFGDKVPQFTIQLWLCTPSRSLLSHQESHVCD